MFAFKWKAGSVAGNLMLKHDHHEFPSDLFIVLETVGSKINISKILKVYSIDKN